jgi:phage head maturation protease
MDAINRPKAGEVEERNAPELEVEGKKIRGRIPYRVESRDMGGWREVIESAALRAAKLDDLVATVDHAGVPIGRYPTTLEVDDRSDGLHWSVCPPESRSDIREAIERGDLKAGSWRMVVARDEWRGDVRHVHEIAELRDVSVVSHPSYPASTVELRSAPDKENTMEDAPKTEERSDEQRSEHEVEETRREPAGSLRVEERVQLGGFASLADAFRSRGFPDETATITADEFRSVTFGGTIDAMNLQRRTGGPLGADQRYAWQAVQQQSVTAGVTSITVTQQTARTLVAGTTTIRAIDATSNKPEVSSTLNLVNVQMKQVAGVQTGVPNVYLEQPQIETVIETDLRLSVYDGLDELVRAAIASSGNQAPSTDNILVSIRKCITTLRAAGYSPNLIILTPSASETVDTMVSGISGGTADFVFGPAQFAPGSLFGIPRVESKVVTWPVVLDTRAHGALYLSPLSLARFEENAGRTNTSLVRLEGHAQYGTERTAAAIRIASS